MNNRGVRMVALPTLFVASIFIAACGPGISSGRSGDTGGRGDESVAPAREATTLVKVRDISGGEAARCLGLEDEVGRRGAELEANEKETFAGLEHAYGPEFCVTAYFTRDGEETVRSYVAGSPLEGFVEVKTVEASLVELEDAQAGAARIAGDLNIPVASDINITKNRAELYPPDQAGFEAALREAGVELPDHVAVLGPEEPPRPPEGTSQSDLDVFFPRQLFGSGGGMMALIRGELTLDENGCLRIVGSGYDSVPVWPADFGIDAPEGGVRVLDKNGQVVGEVGEKIELGGGEIPKGVLGGNDLMEKHDVRELLERCPGDYWLVAAQ